MASNAKIIGDLIASDSSVAIPGDGVILASDLADGSVTTAKLADANVTFDKIATTVPLGTKNLIINGNMQIAQRATSATGLTTGGYRTVDRFYHEILTAGTWSESQDTNVPTGQGFAKSLKINCTSSATLSGTEQTFIQQIIEAQNLQYLKFGTANASSLTVSFWVKSNKTGNYVFWIYQDDDARFTNKVYTINTADTWEKKTITISGDTTGVIDDDNGAGLILRWILGTGSTYTSGTSPDGTWEAYTDANAYAGHAVNLADSTSNYINITGVQLEVGENATPFENRMYSQELAMCQRYYQKLKPLSGNYSPFGIARGDGGTGLLAYLKYAATVRAAPTITVTGTAVNTPSQIDVTGIGIIYSGTDSASVSLVVASSVSSGVCAIWLANVNTTDNIQISAEL